MKTFTSLVVALIGCVHAAPILPSLKANKAEKTKVSTCATIDDKLPIAYIGPCIDTAKAPEWGYISFQPIGLGLAKTSKSMEGYNTNDGGVGVPVQGLNGISASNVASADGLEYAYAVGGVYLGETASLADMDTKIGGYVGSGMYVGLEGAMKTEVDSNTFLVGEDDNARVWAQLSVPYPRKYKAGDVKMNVYGYTSRVNDLKGYAYFGVRYEIKYIGDTLKNPIFTAAGKRKALKVGEYLDGITAIEFTNAKCVVSGDCLVVDVSNTKTLFGPIKAKGSVPKDVASDMNLPEAPKGKKNVFFEMEGTQDKTGNLVINVYRKETQTFWVDFVFSTADLGGAGRYFVFDPEFTSAGEGVDIDDAVTTTPKGDPPAPEGDTTEGDTTEGDTTEGLSGGNTQALAATATALIAAVHAFA